MEKCYYETVETIPEKEETDEISWKYLLRQILVCSGVWASYFVAGLNYGSPTVFIPQLRQEANSSDFITIDMASWLSSTWNYSAIVSSVILAALARLIGRKLTFLFICTTALIGEICLYYSATIFQILISEVILGPLTACPVTISIMVLTEYTSPRYRGVFLTLKSATFLWGIWVANTIGTFAHWKNIVILGLVCVLYSLITSLLWPKSPYWLANKNRLEDCAASHRWLKGCSKVSEAELRTLMESRKGVQSSSSKAIISFKKIVKMFTSKLFYKPILLSMLVLSMYHFSGKIACGMYSIDIIKRITGSESMAYTGMLILDGISVLGMYVGCGLSRYLKRRTLLLVSATISSIFLFGISFYLYFIHLELFVENTIISISLLMGYSLTISVGPMIMSTTILGELIPVKHRSVAILILGGYANFLMGGVVKVSPYILVYLGTYGLFFIFFVCVSVLSFINYKVLPETKDKTLLEIQDSFVSRKFNKKSNDLLSEAD